MLRLGEQWVAFEASSTLSDIFFDDVNQKICTVRGNGALGVTAKGLNSKDMVSFRMKDSGKIKIMKFSPDQRIASIQCDESSVDFICLSSTADDLVTTQFSQSTKMRSARIVGLEWLTNNQLLFVTNQGLELYQVNVEKKNTKLLKTYNISLYWFIYYPKSQLLIVSTGASGAVLNPFLIQNGSLHRLTKFEVDFGSSNAKTNLIEREVTVASIYGSLYVMILRYSVRESSTSDVAMYKLKSDNSEECVLTDTLSLARTGAFAIHVIDNVIIVHHQTSSTSLLFDIRNEAKKQRSGIVMHRPIMSITITRSDRVMSEYRGEIPLYSPSWVIFTPNLIVDASIGIFSTISMYPESAESSFVNQYEFLQFLLNRSSTKELFLEKFKCLLISNQLKLSEISKLFATIVEPYAQRLIAPLKYNEGINKYTLVADAYEPLVIDQSDMFRGVFLPANESATIDKQQFIQTMLHYLLCLQENNIDVEPYFLNEILVPTMVNAGELNRLQQLLHYRVIPDAKQLAFQLLSYEAKHAPLIQLAVDMLARLGTAAEEIVEVLLSRGQLIDAIRFLDSLSPSEKVNSMKLIEHAWKQNRQIRFAVFSYFQNHTTRSTYNNFTNSEQYDDYLRRFKTLFTNDELEMAKRDSQFGVVVPE